MRSLTRRRANYNARGGGVAEGTSRGENATIYIYIYISTATRLVRGVDPSRDAKCGTVVPQQVDLFV